ncbi:MAG: hypothetical protein ACI8ZO_000804 [Flavobacteriales bacterium]|jgi:hypothetical protein
MDHKKNKEKSRLYTLLCLSAYFILINFVGFIIAFFGILNSDEDVQLKELLLIIPLIVLSLYMMAANWEVIFSKSSNKIRRYINVNKLFSLLQITQIKVFGFFYVFSYGVEIMPYYIDRDSAFRFGLSYELFDLNYMIFYNSEANGILIGLNLLPLFMFFMLDRGLKLNDEILTKGVLRSIRNTPDSSSDER